MHVAHILHCSIISQQNSWAFKAFFSVLAKVQQFCHDISQAVTLTTISLPHCWVSGSQMYHDSFSSAKTFPPLVLCSHTSFMCWMDWYDHCFSFVYSWTCCIILWHVALLGCHHHRHVSLGGEFLVGKQVLLVHIRSHYSLEVAVLLEYGSDLLPTRTETLNASCPIAQYTVCLLEQVPGVVAIAHQLIPCIAFDWL